LFFKNFGTFASKKATASGKSTYADLVTRDLTTSTSYDPLDTQAVLHVGWQLPNISASSINISNSRMRNIKKAILKSTRVLRLFLREHTLNFNNDGSVELDLTYNGAIDGVFSDPRTDLMMTIEGQKRLSQLTARIASIRSEVAAVEGEPANDKQNKSIEYYSDKITKLQNNLKDDAMSRFMKELFGPPKSGKSYIKKITVPAALLGAISETENLKSRDIKNFSGKQCKAYQTLVSAIDSASGASDVSDKADAASELTNEMKEHRDTTGRGDKDGVAVMGFNIVDSSSKNRQQALDNANGNFSIKYGTHAPPDRLEKASKVVERAFKLDPYAKTLYKSSQFMDIAFFHYGDLVEVALNVLRDPSNAFHDAYIKSGMVDTFPTPILGPILLREEGCGGTKVRRPGANLADVPISVDFFIDFMTNSFIKPARANLRFRSFISMLNKTILPGALGETCRMESSGQNVQFAHSLPISVKKMGADDGCLGFAAADGGGDKNYVTESYAKRRMNFIDSISSPTGPVKTKEYMLMYVPNYVFTNLSGNRKEDLGKGIYHLDAGGSESAVKTFTIDANKQPFMAEAMTFPRDGKPNLGGDIAGGVRYDINLELLGNTFFKIGFPFYFDLASLSLGSTGDPKTLASRLGIGGYYTCNKLNYIVTPSEFITKIQALFQGGPKQLKSKEESLGRIGAPSPSAPR